MSEGWWLLIALVLFGVLGIMLRNRFLAEGTPFRDWYEAHLARGVNMAIRVLFFVTVAAWLVIWATADDKDRDRLFDEFGGFLKSLEWGAGDDPNAQRPDAQRPNAQRPDAQRPGGGREPR